MLFKTELIEVFTMAEMDKIVKALSAKGIDAATKTVDLMSGGLFENRRSSGFSVQQDFDRLTGVPKSTILHQSHNMELYFEVDDFDAFTEKLRRHLDVELVHPPMTHAWQQRVVRLYDPDWHMIEVGESMEHIALRLLDEGRSVEETAALIHHPTDFVEQCRKGLK